MNYKLPLSLYIHLPWCIRKCPYCDFNSHAKKDIPEQLYIDRLIDDFEQNFILIQQRPLHSIFFGGGTPSLFSAEALDRLLQHIRQRTAYKADMEITLEANPGTVEQQRFKNYREIGINRISLGIQSFDPQQLQKLGRIHNNQEALRAVEIAQQAGFDNINLDLMYGLPQQSIESALLDLQTAIDLQPQHISWYQLTIEPNTVFYKQRPTLPVDDQIYAMEKQGRELLRQAGYLQYEVSAYAREGRQCQHNLNYWRFGDYLGIGAGAHGKSTDLTTGHIKRLRKLRQPDDYLDKTKSLIAEEIIIDQSNLIFEFMLNALRLQEAIPLALFTERTGLNSDVIMDCLAEASEKKFIRLENDTIFLTEHGRLFLNDVMAVFLVDDD